MVTAAVVLWALMALTAGIRLGFYFVHHRSITYHENLVYQARTQLMFVLGLAAGCVGGALICIHVQAWIAVGAAGAATILCLIWAWRLIRQGGFKLPQ